VRGLVELHEGTINARSEGEGKGSEFTVRLPISTASTELTGSLETRAVRPAIGKRILVIDDNIDAADSLALLLEMNGHTTSSVHDGTTGIITAEEFCPDVILLDIGLPDINGYEVARRIRQHSWGKKIFLIAATGWGQDKDKALAMAAGFDNHLTKPIDYQKLTLLLQKLFS
jgi:CheY-like chemotaxis protein